jgi:1-acyl-sn-glycerol-3-phosphate acyltransferase
MTMFASAFRSAVLWCVSAALIALWVPLVAAAWLVDRDPVKRRTGRTFRALGVVLARLHRARLHLQREDLPDPERHYVVVSNHQSLADIPVLCHLPWEMKWLAKAELFRLPFVGWMMRLAADIPVHRGRRAKAADALRRASRTLESGCSIMVFPEGTRSRDGRVAPFSDGAFHLALRTRVPILPVAVHGSGGCLPRGTWLFGPPSEIRMRVFPPVETRDRDPSDVATLREQVHRAIAYQVAAWRGADVIEVQDE